MAIVMMMVMVMVMVMVGSSGVGGSGDDDDGVNTTTRVTISEKDNVSDGNGVMRVGGGRVVKLVVKFSLMIEQGEKVNLSNLDFKGGSHRWI